METKNKFWDIEILHGEDKFMTRLLAMLLGLPLGMVEEHVSKDRMTAREIKLIIEDLGYNHDSNFKKFDKDTEYPCILRCTNIYKDNKGSWYAFIFKDGLVYSPVWEYPVKLYNFSMWAMSNGLQITTMLRVWL